MMKQKKRNRLKGKIKNNKTAGNTKKFGIKLSLEKVNWEKVDAIFAKEREEALRRLKLTKDGYPTTRDILTLLAGGAVFGLSLVFPTLPMALAPLLVTEDRYNRSRVNHVLRRLQKQKLVEIVYPDGHPLVKITQDGKIRALRYKLGEITVSKPKRWDGKWRIVVFDIPEKYKRMREIFRYHLKTMGFYPLQKSVWVHAYACFDEIEFLRQVYYVGLNVSYIIADKIEDSDYLKSRFELS